jgi:hypothetical protein
MRALSRDRGASPDTDLTSVPKFDGNAFDKNTPGPASHIHIYVRSLTLVTPQIPIPISESKFNLHFNPCHI